MSDKAIHVYRGEFIESTHDIHAAVTDTNGNLLYYYGNPMRATFTRSSMKPFQTIPVVESGAIERFGFIEKDISLFCASHSGEPFHRERVQHILHTIGLKEQDLQCGTHIPRDLESYKQLIKENKELNAIYSNCSGKHSGMLATCVHMNEEIKTYRNKEHPHQIRILNSISTICSFPVEKIALSVDGCGVPVHQLPLQNLAIGFARLAKSENWHTSETIRKTSLAKIAESMAKYPEMVAGTNRFDTDLMKEFQGRLVAKGGAEGVQCIGDRESGIGIALKVEDGNARGASVAAMHILRELNIGTEDVYSKLQNYEVAPVLNSRQEKIGKIVSAFTLHKS
ncbi:asparaginase [Heyndrickxia sporothermodurans]